MRIYSISPHFQPQLAVGAKNGGGAAAAAEEAQCLGYVLPESLSKLSKDELSLMFKCIEIQSQVLRQDMSEKQVTFRIAFRRYNSDSEIASIAMEMYRRFNGRRMFVQKNSEDACEVEWEEVDVTKTPPPSSPRYRIQF